jgi:hypothetical protein
VVVGESFDLGDDYDENEEGDRFGEEGENDGRWGEGGCDNDDDLDSDDLDSDDDDDDGYDDDGLYLDDYDDSLDEETMTDASYEVRLRRDENNEEGCVSGGGGGGGGGGDISHEKSFDGSVPHSASPPLMPTFKNQTSKPKKE